MLALDPSHEQLLIAAIGGIVSIIIVALPITIAVINSQNRRTQKVIVAGQELAALTALTAAKEVKKDITPHLPPNGRRLHEMVSTTADTVQEMQQTLMRLQYSVGEQSNHIMSLHELDAETRAMLLAHLEKTAPLVAFVETQMRDQDG